MDREFQQCGGESWAAGVSGNENGEGAEQAAGASEERRIHEINLLNSQHFLPLPSVSMNSQGTLPGWGPLIQGLQT